MKVVKIILASLAALAIVALAGAVTVQGQHLSRLESKSQAQQQKIALETSRIDGLDNSVSNLTQPSDPLSAYNNICNQQMTNSNTGISQTYYFPCTNSAQTIPQPGN